MWFEMQKVGIEAGFYTTKTAFCCSASVQEGLEIVRRTGISLFLLYAQTTYPYTVINVDTRTSSCAHLLS